MDQRTSAAGDPQVEWTLAVEDLETEEVPQIKGTSAAAEHTEIEGTSAANHPPMDEISAAESKKAEDTEPNDPQSPQVEYTWATEVSEIEEDNQRTWTPKRSIEGTSAAAEHTKIEGTSAANDPAMDEISAAEFKEAEDTEPNESRERTHWPKNSIFRVPEHIRSSRVSNFEPKLVSIGPYYHGRENLERMQNLKIRCIEEILKMLGIAVTRKNHPRPREADIPRNNFSMYRVTIFGIETKHSTLLKGMGIDAEFLGQFMDSARKAKAYYKVEFYHDDDEFVKMLFLDSCFIIRTIFAFSQQTQSMSFLDVHIKEVRSDLLLLDMKLTSSERYRSEAERDLSNSSEIDPSNNALMVIANATELQQMAGIEFEKFKDTGHLDVTFSKGIMRMPHLKIDSRQITLLRNLIAFENCVIPSMRTISCYMKLMDALINSEKDVELLQNCGVIYNTLSSHEMAATFFNDIGDFCFTNDHTNRFSGLYKDVQKYYDSSWHRRLASLRHNYAIYGYHHPKN